MTLPEKSSVVTGSLLGAREELALDPAQRGCHHVDVAAAKAHGRLRKIVGEEACEVAVPGLHPKKTLFRAASWRRSSSMCVSTCSWSMTKAPSLESSLRNPQQISPLGRGSALSSRALSDSSRRSSLNEVENESLLHLSPYPSFSVKPSPSFPR